MDTLSGLDATFLYLETPETPMHIGSFCLYELQEENRRLHDAAKPAGFAGIITRDTEMLRLCRTAEKVATTSATILVLGESGTGKELVARALHELSPRRKERWVAINCAAIPETLLESELFGYEKGAFTGATKQTLGKIETANKGTLFLDEIGDLSLPLQGKLLRFLQERVIERVGGREEIPVDVRIVCATHQNLKDMIGQGNFREDLYFRLAEIVLEIVLLKQLSILILHRLDLITFGLEFSHQFRITVGGDDPVELAAIV